MLQLLFYLFGLHGATEIEYPSRHLQFHVDWTNQMNLIFIVQNSAITIAG